MRIYKSKAIKHFGSQLELANALGISKQAVGKWPPRRPIPKKQAQKLIDEYPEVFGG